MQVVLQWIAMLALTALVASPALAQVPSSRGMASISYSGATPTPDQRVAARNEAKVNALERFIAETNPAKQRLFDAARTQLLAIVDSLILSSTAISETDDPAAKTFTSVVRVEINSSRLDNALADASGASPESGDGPPVVVVFVARAPASVQTFDDRVFKRVEATADGQASSAVKTDTTESERIRSSSISTSDMSDTRVSATARSSSTVETGGSVTRRADKVEWTVISSEDVDQQMTGIFANAGLEVVPSEFVVGLDLSGTRKDFGEGDDLNPETLRALVAAVRGSQVPYLILGTMDQGLADRDPVSGNNRVYVKVKARIYDLTRPFPRVLSAIEPTEYAGLGPATPVARTNALRIAATEVAKKLVDEITVKGVR